MSTTTSTATMTADQPFFHVNNIVAHNGSSWAGAGIAAMAIGQQLAAGDMPTTKAGWGIFAFQMAMAVAAALGK